MYQTENLQSVIDSGKTMRSRRGLVPHVSRTVLLLGFTSFFTDISSEMVSTILPLYLVFGLGLTPLQFGIVDGLYQGAAALVRVASGFVADRWHRHKEVAIAGYGLSALCKIGFLLVGGAWTALAGIVLIDRTGKGIRTAPRDAMISLSTPTEELGTAFGVHRALDTVGAMLGPLVAFGLLAALPNAYDVVFVVSFFVALIGLGVLTLFVENHTALRNAAAARTVSISAALGLLRAPRFRMLVLIGAALGLVTMSDGFLYLSLQRRLDFNIGFLPLLYVATAVVYMLLAVPVGRLADRVGRGRVFIGGYLLLLLVYTSLLLPTLGRAQVLVYIALFGAYYAATDGVVMALVSAVLPTELRGSGLALFATATNVARLLASVLFGALWSWRGVETAVQAFILGLIFTIILAAIALVRTEHSAAHEQAASS